MKLAMQPRRRQSHRPFGFEEWEDFLKDRYEPGKTEEQFRNYKADANPVVTEFYRKNHTYQTFDFVMEKKAQYGSLKRGKKSIWAMADYLNTLVDDSDPDTDLTQIEHLLQTSEAMRKDGQPRWFVLTGFMHDLGKVLCLYGEPQWAVVGDTFPVGCAYSDQIVFPEFFAANPDSKVAEYQTEYGIYKPNAVWTKCICPGDMTNISIWQRATTCRSRLNTCCATTPSTRRTATAAYRHLMNSHDVKMFDWVNKFNPYDLYSKSLERPNAKESCLTMRTW